MWNYYDGGIYYNGQFVAQARDNQWASIICDMGNVIAAVDNAGRSGSRSDVEECIGGKNIIQFRGK